MLTFRHQWRKCNDLPFVGPVALPIGLATSNNVVEVKTKVRMAVPGLEMLVGRIVLFTSDRLAAISTQVELLACTGLADCCSLRMLKISVVLAGIPCFPYR